MRKPAKAASAGVSSLVTRVERGDQAAVSRALSLVTNESEGYEELARAFFTHHGRSHKIGLFGPPGSGKSSLINRLVAQFRKSGERVGVLAVDPTSPFTGGAFLGDRLRVQEHALDEGVFMRSLANRGMLGGLSATIFGAVHVLEAYGCDRILLETVGTGQDEVDIAQTADTVLCVSAPYQGDEFQAMKAGSMEVADIFAVNKSDLADVDKTVASLREALSLGQGPRSDWKVKVLAVSAMKDAGVPELRAAIDEHRDFLRKTSEGGLRAKKQLRYELSLLVSRRLYRDALGRIKDKDIEMLLANQSDPVTLGRKLAVRGRSLSVPRPNASAYRPRHAGRAP